MALVHILVDVFHGAEVEGDFCIDMTLKLQEEEWRKKAYILVVHHMTSDVMVDTIIWAIIKWVFIIIDRIILLKRFREVL